jgi:hypothetical protein
LLRRAASGPLPALLGQEAGFLLGEASCLAGEAAAGAAALSSWRSGALGGADRTRADVALRRCAFAGLRR